MTDARNGPTPPPVGPPHVEIKLAAHAVGAPTYATEGAAGADLAAALPEGVSWTLEPGAHALVPTGVLIALPAGYEAQVRPRSGLAARDGVTVLNAPGTIDADYRGEIKVPLINHGRADFTLRRGDRIAQLVLAQVARAEWRPVAALSTTARGAAGFGSTGVAQTPPPPSNRPPAKPTPPPVSTSEKSANDGAELFSAVSPHAPQAPLQQSPAPSTTPATSQRPQPPAYDAPQPAMTAAPGSTAEASEPAAAQQGSTPRPPDKTRHPEPQAQASPRLTTRTEAARPRDDAAPH